MTFFDVTTLRIAVGQFEDDKSWSRLRTLVAQIRPVEVIMERQAMGDFTLAYETYASEISKMLRNSPVVPTMTGLHASKMWGYIKTCSKLEEYFG